MTFIDLIYVLVWLNYVRIKCQHDYRRALLWKMLTSFSFLVIAASCLVRNQSRYGVFIMAGLLFGCLGDYYLDMKYVVLKNSRQASDRYTFYGFGAFVGAHLMNIMGMLSNDSSLEIDTNTLVSRAIASLIISGLIVSQENLFKVQYGKFKAISFFYAFVLISTTFISLELFLHENSGRSQMLMLSGLISFLLSDLVLSQTFFGENANTAPFIIANYVFYYGAQWLIAKSIDVTD